jgi:large subunit ribosomal protein L4e
LATASAIAFTADIGAVKGRGHRVGDVSLPLVVSDDLETVEKTSELVSFLEKIDLGDEVERMKKGTKRNSGHARLRGRAYSNRVGPLIVVTNDRGIGKAASSVPGLGLARVDSVNVTQLAPGGVPGRLTLWTESSIGALSAMNKEGNKSED